MGMKDLIKKEGEVFGDFSWADSFSDRFDNLWSMPISKMFRGLKAWNLQADIRETDKEVRVSVTLAGVEKKDINLDIGENSLTITAERKQQKEEKDEEGNYTLKEQSYGIFKRTFALPASVKSDAAKASYKDGVLKISLPKQKETKKHRVEIE